MSTLKNLGMRAAGGVGVGLARALRSRAGGRVGILAYHRIARGPGGLPAPLHNVTPEALREQISGLRRRGFHFWPLRRLLGLRTGPEAIPARTVVVTFDDGYGTVYANAWPVLRELQVPATVFVCTAYLDGRGPFPFDAWGRAHEDRAPEETYRPLTTEQCREMIGHGLIEVGSHTHTHADFRDDPDAFAGDLRQSVDLLRSRFPGRPIPFAFPFGSRHRGFASEALVSAARRTGVSCGLSMETTLVDPRIDPFHWGRFNVFSWDTSATLAAKLEGWYSWAPRTWQGLADAAVRLRSPWREGPTHGAS